MFSTDIETLEVKFPVPYCNYQFFLKKETPFMYIENFIPFHFSLFSGQIYKWI